jgi:hypothetical protein
LYADSYKTEVHLVTEVAVEDEGEDGGEGEGGGEKEEDTPPLQAGDGAMAKVQQLAVLRDEEVLSLGDVVQAKQRLLLSGDDSIRSFSRHEEDEDEGVVVLQASI